MGRDGGPYIRVMKHFNLQSVKLSFLSNLQHKTGILAFFTSCKMWNIFKVIKTPEYVDVDTVDVVLASILLTLKAFDFLWQCLYCLLWYVQCRLGSLCSLFWRFLPAGCIYWCIFCGAYIRGCINGSLSVIYFDRLGVTIR